MDASTRQRLGQLALTNPKEFLEQLFDEQLFIDEHVYLESFLNHRSSINSKGFTLKIVESIGGREGEGESVRRVIEVSDSTGGVFAHIAIRGFYDSWEGITWDTEYTNVHPQQVTITQYV